jgi:hypothetical protein
MENEEVIREKMEDTRTALTDKLEKLEEKVSGTVEGATDTVSDTVEAVKETVQETKEAVVETVEAVKDTVKETVATVKDTVQDGLSFLKDCVNIPLQAQRQPWLVMGGAVASGFFLGRWLTPPAAPKAAAPEGAQSTRVLRNGGHRERAPASAAKGGMLEGLLEQFRPELTQLKNLGLAMVMGVLRDMMSRAVPKEFAPQLTGIFDRVGAKLRGEEPQEEEPEQSPGYAHEETRHDEGRQADGRRTDHGKGQRHRGNKFGRN